MKAIFGSSAAALGKPGPQDLDPEDEDAFMDMMQLSQQATMLNIPNND